MKKKLLNSFFLFFLGCTLVNAQTYSGTGGAVMPTGNDVVFTQIVSGLGPSMNSSFGITQLCLNLSHPDLTEVSIELVSPSGKSVEMVSNNPTGGPDYLNTCFDGSAGSSITAGTAPYTGSFRPTGYMGLFNNGSNPNGAWKLLIKIWNIAGVPGTLNSWSITFGPNPLVPVNLTSSNLPLVLISTLGQNIQNEPKKIMNMSIIYNGPGIRNNVTDAPNNYNGKVAIEYRGSSSLQFQKKSMSLETVDNAGNDLDVSLLNMPAEHDWILYASYIDKTLIRNALTFDLAMRMGNYAPRGQFVEVLIDGEYQGVYILEEKIKRGDQRVDISKLSKTDNAGDAMTGGYMLRIDKRDGTEGGFKSHIAPPSGSTDTVFFQYYYPKDTTITPQQQSYIKNYFWNFEQNLQSGQFAHPIDGYVKFIEPKSFVDYFIISELSKNVDAYKVSTYIYKDKDSKGGKLNLGPVWDYDLAWANSNFGDGVTPVGWQYQHTALVYETPFWWQRLMQDPNFVNKIKCRWEELKTRSIITPATLYARIDSLTNYLSESQARNFTMWPILDANVWANPSPIPSTYSGHAAELKNWIASRFGWIDGSLPGVASNCYVSTESVEPEKAEVRVYPNPFRDQVTFSVVVKDMQPVILKIYDAFGKEVMSVNDKNNSIGERQIVVNGESLKPGVYFYRMLIGNKSVSGKIIMQK
jgi:subtilisin-like proprotein convertase family protein